MSDEQLIISRQSSCSPLIADYSSFEFGKCSLKEIDEITGRW